MLIQNPGVVPQGLAAPRTAHTPRAPSKVPPVLSPLLVAFPVRNPDSGPTSFLGPGTLVLLESQPFGDGARESGTTEASPGPAPGRPRVSPFLPLPAPVTTTE